MIKEFIEFSPKCPVCENRLTWYLQVVGYGCFTLQEQEDNFFCFQKLQTSQRKQSDFKAERLMCLDYDSKIELLDFPVGLENKEVFIFGMCNFKGFEFQSFNSDYEICAYKSCSYRSSVFMKKVIEFPSQQPVLIPQVSEEEQTPSDYVREESLAFGVDREFENEDFGKYYLLNIKYLEKKTMLYHFCVSTKKINDESYELKEDEFLSREIPFLKNRLNFSLADREKLHNKFACWVMAC